MIKAHSRGWKIYFDGNDWRYSDNGKLADDSRSYKRWKNAYKRRL